MVFGCVDNDLSDNDVGYAIVGKWQLEATKISPGGIVDWVSVEDGETYVFRQDGTFGLSKWEGCKSPVEGTFTVTEEMLKLFFPCNSEPYEPVYTVSFEENKLILGFLGCIEGCLYRYKRMD